jgi:hypothetical protein
MFPLNSQNPREYGVRQTSPPSKKWVDRWSVREVEIANRMLAINEGDTRIIFRCDEAFTPTDVEPGIPEMSVWPFYLCKHGA